MEQAVLYSGHIVRIKLNNHMQIMSAYFHRFYGCILLVDLKSSINLSSIINVSVYCVHARPRISGLLHLRPKAVAQGWSSRWRRRPGAPHRHLPPRLRCRVDDQLLGHTYTLIPDTIRITILRKARTRTITPCEPMWQCFGIAFHCACVTAFYVRFLFTVFIAPSFHCAWIDCR